MKETKFQKELKDHLKERFPGFIVIKNDPNQIQGFPDLTILYKDKWGTLEIKKDAKAKRRPNQEYYVEKMNEMSFSSIIFPENEEEVLDALERSFKTNKRTTTRVSGRK